MKIEEIKRRYKEQWCGCIPDDSQALIDILTLLSRIKELEKIISDGILKDHDGCLIYRDEEYTKLESKFYIGEERIKELEEIRKDERKFRAEAALEIDRLKTRIKELEEELRISIKAYADTMNGQAKRIKELEDQVLRMIRGDFPQICSYCGWESKDGQWEELQKHIKECPTHPLREYAKRIEELEEGLAEIAEGKGAYNPDRMKHAENTIRDMKEIAKKLLEGK